MTAPMNGISKLMLRYGRDVRNTRHLIYVPRCQSRSSPYISPTNNTLLQKRLASTVEALVYQDRQRIPKSDLPVTPAAGPRKRPALQLRTLDQTRLGVQDFVHLNGRIRKDLRFPLAPEQPRLQMRYVQPNVPFPLDTQGFLYWHLDPDAPLLSGQVRFRTTPSADPAIFPNGRDLQLPDGGTWNISLFDIARRSRYSGFRAYLISEKLVTAKVLYTALSISAPFGERQSIQPPAAFSFGRSSAGEMLSFLSLFSVRIQQSGSTGIAQKIYYRPFTGRALVQFERSALPEHKGTRTVVLRIVKLIDLTRSEGSDASGMPEPKEGGLVMAHTKGGHSWRVWSFDVDGPQSGSGLQRSSSRALAILFDNEARQSR
ncbi:hypothetical protein OE88DRAFT_1739661 [Heliocybe sulcata]|uniref:Uncharacterized protein n=1 Tax=Heliocybe sulcata TaxID=5364 RepID=A0A5C3MN84_9AGAM|nr:hypothetical protein OE88DRAFT_1739661 [Heliocybe sulcata]